MRIVEGYEQFDGLGLAELVKKKEVTPLELVETAISHIEEVNPQLNAVIHTMYDTARATARGLPLTGPFAGVPFLLKDLGHAYKGAPLRAGCRFLNDYVPDFDAEVVKRFKAAGVIVLGKTNTPELGVSPHTEPELFGATRNPWDLTRSTGGSSGGSAAAVAARMVPMASGSDGGGSIRMPASFCGLFGLKPTRGRVPLSPTEGEIWQGFICDHVLTRSVRDSAAMLDAIAGPGPGAPYYPPPPGRPYLEEVTRPPGKLRIAFSSKPIIGVSVDGQCCRALEETAIRLKELGHELVEADLQVDHVPLISACTRMAAGEIGADVAAMEKELGRRATRGDFEINNWLTLQLARRINATEFASDRRFILSYARQVAEFLESFDVFLTPTMSTLPFPLGTMTPSKAELFAARLVSLLHAYRVLRWGDALDKAAQSIYEVVSFTALFNYTGHPAMSVPLCWSQEGLPIGMQFVARYGDEATLFRLAGQLEEAFPWCDRVPPIGGKS